MFGACLLVCAGCAADAIKWIEQLRRYDSGQHERRVVDRHQKLVRSGLLALQEYLIVMHRVKGVVPPNTRCYNIRFWTIHLLRQFDDAHAGKYLRDARCEALVQVHEDRVPRVPSTACVVVCWNP